MGLDPRLEAALCYLLGWVSGLVFFFLERRSRLVRFHSLQAILFGAVLTVAHYLADFLTLPLALEGLIGAGLTGIWLAMTVVLMYMAGRGEYYRLPYLGDLAERSLGG